MNELCRLVVSRLNTWKYKREQPSNPEKLADFVQTALNKGEPIKFLMYWGKGDRKEVDKPEKKAFNFIEGFLSEVKKVYPTGSNLTLVFTDTHARLNGYEDDEITPYFRSVKSLADNSRYQTKYLSELVQYNEEELAKQIEAIDIDAKLLEILTGSSRKHYKVSQNYDYAAKIYYLQNQLEKKSLDKTFPEHIFLTFNGSEFNPLFPTTLPIFYMYSLEKGTSVKPWFEDGAVV